MNTSRLWLVTGERGAGKTRFCREVAKLARQAGILVGGLLSPAVFTGFKKTGIQVQSLYTGEIRLLALQNAQPPFNLQLGEWYFDSQVLSWGNRELENACMPGENKKPIDLLVIDEIGPLELLQGKGWTAALTFLTTRNYRDGLVVIRPELTETARQKLPCLQGTITLTNTMDPEEKARAWWEHIYHD